MIKFYNYTTPGSCPISEHLAFVQKTNSLSCGKCTPCAEGFVQVEKLLKKINNCKATNEDFENLLKLAKTINQTADCAVGHHAAKLLLDQIDEHKAGYESHINHECTAKVADKTPCSALCPANVDIPAYISLIAAGKYEDAIRVIRNDNPFVTACAFICEHPCEAKCRRNLLDDAINIRGLKKYAVNKIPTNEVKVPENNVDTGKKIAVVGAGPSGLTAAYFLALMGHKVTVFERHDKAGGMLRYGIPNYRLPKKRLDEDIEMILNTGNIEIKYNTNIEDLESLNFDATYVSIGAQAGKKLNLEGTSAVEFLDDIANGKAPDYTGKNVIVVGGGNVAMDAARSAVRCGAASTTIVYRRRQADMTALEDEIQGAIEEGVEILTLHSPKEVKGDKFIAQPQLISTYDRNGRPRPVDASKAPGELDCDVCLIAIGQDVEQKLQPHNNIFVGGDCLTGPATVIKAIDAGKKAAVAIDEYLGYHHKFREKIDIPKVKANNRELCGRVELTNISASERKTNFDAIENNMSDEEAMQECSKCLRCDHFGCADVEEVR